MCHPGLDQAVMCAATTGPRLATLAGTGPAVPTQDDAVGEKPQGTSQRNLREDLFAAAANAEFNVWATTTVCEMTG